SRRTSRTRGRAESCANHGTRAGMASPCPLSGAGRTRKYAGLASLRLTPRSVRSARAQTATAPQRGTLPARACKHLDERCELSRRLDRAPTIPGRRVNEQVWTGGVAFKQYAGQRTSLFGGPNIGEHRHPLIDLTQTCEQLAVRHIATT